MTRASVTVNGEIIDSIGPGLVILLGVARGDSERDVRYLADKCINLRIFSDSEGKFNLSVKDVQGSVLAVSQFTLLADARKGRRPNFIEAAAPQDALTLFNLFKKEVINGGVNVAAGRFQEHMLVEILNDGPVTVLLDSQKKYLPIGTGDQNW